jgi:hypothetical protein
MQGNTHSQFGLGMVVRPKIASEEYLGIPSLSHKPR